MAAAEEPFNLWGCCGVVFTQWQLERVRSKDANSDGLLCMMNFLPTEGTYLTPALR